MANATEPQQPPKKPGGLLSWFTSLPLRIAAVLIVSIISSIVMEWVGIALGWWDLPGAAHGHTILMSEVQWIDTQFNRSLLFSDPVQTARHVMAFVYQSVFVSTGIAPWLAGLSQGGPLETSLMVYGQAALYSSLVVLVRLMILTLTLPLFAMAAFAGFVDGLVRRDLRRFGAGRESAFIYHHAKRLVGATLTGGWILYLGLPWSVHPSVFLLPCAVLSAFLLSVAVGTFKKYL